MTASILAKRLVLEMAIFTHLRADAACGSVSGGLIRKSRLIFARPESTEQLVLRSCESVEQTFLAHVKTKLFGKT